MYNVYSAKMQTHNTASSPAFLENNNTHSDAKYVLTFSPDKPYAEYSVTEKIAYFFLKDKIEKAKNQSASNMKVTSGDLVAVEYECNGSCGNLVGTGKLSVMANENPKLMGKLPVEVIGMQVGDSKQVTFDEDGNILQIKVTDIKKYQLRNE